MKRFVGERDNFIVNSTFHLKPMKRFKYKCDARVFRRVAEFKTTEDGLKRKKEDLAEVNYSNQV